MRTDVSRASEAMKALLGLAEARGLWMTRTKSAKLLYLADLRSVESDGVTGSGVVWQWRNYGPFSNDLYSVEDRLAASGDITVEETNNYFGSPEYRLRAAAATTSLDEASPFLVHLDDVLSEHGGLSPSELKDLTYETEPMREAQADGERNVILDLGDTAPIPGASATLHRFQRMLDNYVDDEEPAPPGCRPEILNPLRANRARANQILLDD
ncbi:Panacea domain-containing protein [Candidatus Poriferisodalis sp.]|uniref:Panacea domain-containing protein n=1 Tax=Candidatus Poriferisodalis sp. TaxID=3101277 RepID=UPI003B017764